MTSDEVVRGQETVHDVFEVISPEVDLSPPWVELAASLGTVPPFWREYLLDPSRRLCRSRANLPVVGVGYVLGKAVIRY